MTELTGNINTTGKDNFSAFDSLKENVPDDIRNAREAREKQAGCEVGLFFSFDIVNSSKYKHENTNWPIVIKHLLESVRKAVMDINELAACFLWRVIGDEMVFVLPVQTKLETFKAVEHIFKITQRIHLLLKSGKFFEAIPDQSLTVEEIKKIRENCILSIKSTAWIAVIKERLESPYDNIRVKYMPSNKNQEIIEYIGMDMDAGFRLKNYAKDKRLLISFELAYILKKFGCSKNFYLVDLIKMEEVWGKGLCPIIWYYDEEIEKNLTEQICGSNVAVIEKEISYENYKFISGCIEKIILEDKLAKCDENATYEQIINGILEQVLEDSELQSKIEYIEKNFRKDGKLLLSQPFPQPLELHCAVVCCDVETGKIMIARRNNERSLNPGRWEFGCARANSEKPLIVTIEDYYKEAFGLSIKLYIDKDREDKQPLPIAVYEIGEKDNIKKGIIFIAEASEQRNNFRSNTAHDEVRWVTKEEAKGIEANEAVNDFHNTVNKAFRKFAEISTYKG